MLVGVHLGKVKGFDLIFINFSKAKCTTQLKITLAIKRDFFQKKF